MATDPIVFAVEPLAPLLADGLEDILFAHWREVEQHQDEMPLSVDWSKYLMLERVGIYHVVTGRHRGRLAGYAAYFVQPPLHHRQNTWAVNDVLFLAQNYRRGATGVRLIEFAEARMKELGAQLITQEDRKLPNSTSEKPRATLGDLLLRKGYTLAGKVYAKLL